MIPSRAIDPYDWPALLSLIQTEFAGMEGRIDPPSSMLRLTPEAIARQAETGEIWVVEDNTRPIACIFLTPQPDRLYLGKLAVSAQYRGRGLARRLVTQARTRAEALGLPVLELQTRVELIENHKTFARLGFTETGRTAHPGHTQPTSITMRMNI